MTESVLRLEAVRRVYPCENEVVALHGVDLLVGAGELVAIVGPSGSGKSTLLHLMGALDTPTSGRVLIDGRDTKTMGEHERTLLRRDHIGFVFQFFNLLPLLSARENAAMPLYLAGRPRREAEARADLLLVRVGLSHRAGHRPAQLSGGERQRLAAARALAAHPRLILADEPTGNLDRAHGAQLLDLFGDLVASDGLSIVLVTHDPEAAARASRVIRIVDGRIDSDAAKGTAVNGTATAAPAATERNTP